jgi:FecR protein
LVTISLLSQTTSNAEVGKVTEQTGPTTVQRNSDKLTSQVDFPVEMNDIINTDNSVTRITFKDDTKVEVNDHSRLLIDSFVYDASKSTGKVSMKAMMGTVRYASGAIAHANPESVNVETPTAQIGVRGTDFTMTVDELGRSLVILLPSCPVGYHDVERDCKTGKIIVKTDGDEVIMDKSFQATVVNSRDKAPTKPVILKLEISQINNLLILTPPKEIKASEPVTQKKYNPLGDMLDEDLLDVNFLQNVLTVVSNTPPPKQTTNNAIDKLLPNYVEVNEPKKLKYNLSGSNVSLFRTDDTNNYAQVNINTNNAATVNITQSDNISVSQQVNRSGSTTISIKQGN